ncbi:MAG: hypothetical protein RDU59_06360 [Thermodesulfobacteriota bacterium]|nr:hypothetical protein [Thermodesulfobacteriota bacterium]
MHWADIEAPRPPQADLGRTGNLRMQGKMHRIRSLTPLQAAGNALAMHVHYNFVKSALPLSQNRKKYFVNNHLTKT